MADLRAGGPIPLARGCLGAFDPAARGHELLHPREAREVMPCIPEHETADLAKARDGLEPRPRVGIMRLGRRDHGPRQIPAQSIIVPNQGTVDVEALLHGGSRKPLHNTITVGCGGDLLADLRQIVRTGRLLDRRQQRSPVAHQMPAPPEHIPGGPQVSGIDVRLRSHAPRRSTAIFWASSVSCVALPPCMAFMYRAWPKTKGIPSWVHRSASQVPGEETFDADHEILAIGRNRLEKRLRCCPHMPVEPTLSSLV
jgi:hypothetical protein